MINLDYASQQISGVWRLAFDRSLQDEDVTQQENFDYSIDGFFKSFWAIAFAIPFALLSFLAARQYIEKYASEEATAIQEIPIPMTIAINSVTFLFDWGLSIFAIILVAKTLQVTKTIVVTVIRYNWASMINTTLNAIALSIISFFGKAASIVVLPATAISLVLLWTVFRRSMHTTPSITIVMLLMLTLISLLVGVSFSSLSAFFFQASS